jgi:glycosyltransferase involved in cell wall biosynthesis
MRVLLLHNRYQIQGGEDTVVAQETEMMRARGVVVDVFEVNNETISGAWGKIDTTLHMIYSSKMREQVHARIRSFQPSVMHVHNFFPRLTPAVYDAAIEEQVPVVQTLHNYRLMCSGGMFFRNDRICMDCVEGKSRMPALLHKCYRGSLPGTAALNTMMAFHDWKGTWQSKVDRFIVLTSFARSLFIEHARIPAERIVVKANVVPDIAASQGDKDYAIYVGRLSPEKGISTTLRAVQRPQFPLPLKVVGSGPLQEEVERNLSGNRVEFVGKRSSREVHELVRNARMLIAPSMWHEAGVPLVIGEALSAGVPVITTRIQPMDSVIEHGINGLTIEPGDDAELCQAACRIATDAVLHAHLSREARRTYEQLYQPDANFNALMGVYEAAMRKRVHDPLASA